MRADGPLPAIWYIRDAEIQEDGSTQFLGRFCSRDELKRDPSAGDAYFGDLAGSEIRARLRGAPTPLQWAGYRQSFDLAVFGLFDCAVWEVEAALVVGDQRRHDPPKRIEEWEPFMRMSVLTYSAYFEAFYPPGRQIVGGGVDVEWIAWPA